MKRELLIHKGDSPQELFSAVKQFLGMYENGVIVTVEPYCSPRTAKQNGTYQLWVKRIHSQTGIPTDQLKKMAKEMGFAENGYRLIINCGNDGGQEVPHLHLHLLGGEKLRIIGAGF